MTKLNKKNPNKLLKFGSSCNPVITLKYIKYTINVSCNICENIEFLTINNSKKIL